MNRVVEGQIRTLRSAPETALGVTITIEMNIAPRIARHAAWLRTRFQIRSDGFTAYKKVKQRAYGGDVAEFGEIVFLK